MAGGAQYAPTSATLRAEMKTGWWKILGALLTAGLLACGPVAPLGADNAVSRAEQVLGPEGGSLRVEGARLTVPGGALASDTLVHLRRLREPGPALPEHLTALTDRFEIGPERVSLGGAPRLEITYEGDASRVVLVEHSVCEQAIARDAGHPGNTVGSGTASVEITSFGTFSLATVLAEACASAEECPCDEACATPGTMSYCDGSTGRCTVRDGCDQPCDCPGFF
mgnify:CR=1 FL=1